MGTVQNVAAEVLPRDDISKPDVRERLREETSREVQRELRERVVGGERLRRAQALVAAEA